MTNGEIPNRTKGRTRKRFPNNGRLAHQLPLGFNLIHHQSARLVDEGGVQRRVLRENELHDRPRVSWCQAVQADGLLRGECRDGQDQRDLCSYTTSPRCAVNHGACIVLQNLPVPAGRSMAAVCDELKSQ